MLLASVLISAAEALNVQSDASNVTRVFVVKVRPGGYSIEKWAHLWRRDVSWIKASGTMTHIHLHFLLSFVSTG